jgi:hypothetical protein
MRTTGSNPVQVPRNDAVTSANFYSEKLVRADEFVAGTVPYTVP